ncbi:Demethylsterigmatocystin 6-O-methyltransferase [Cytospora mali]|uniref:Demethylsterigmatocystin 6-O-methyltransferase n=1 Tax=Cytospora mali TaxID=578113 RepID=A0A194UTK0_CYTMA|nr:Demethylsterigmatocystin 6-O-methyltransferase [Valsa mali var. pyri (nom. inval.)]
MATSVKDLIASLDGLPADISEAERMELTDALRRNLHRLQTPFERAWEMTLAAPHLYAAIKTTLDLGLWEAWRSAGGEEKSLDDLVKMCNKECNPNLLRRLVRILVAREVVVETGVDKFKTNRFSDALGEQNIAVTMRCATHHWYPMALNIPDHLAEIGYQMPTDAEKSAYINMTNNPEGLSFFARCRWRPEYQESFVACMTSITNWKQNWTEYFDTAHLVDEKVINGKGPIFVDIGGNTGMDVMRFLDKHPDVSSGSVILQDVPDVVAMANVGPKVKAVAYDFFKPQPVRDSRIYFLHSILHDWPDKLATEILENLKPAFKKGYSRLVVTDVVIPAEKPSIMQATHDLCLMGLLAAGERTEADWRKLLEDVGFRIINVWKDTRGIESVIEAELADDAE